MCADSPLYLCISWPIKDRQVYVYISCNPHGIFSWTSFLIQKGHKWGKNALYTDEKVNFECQCCLPLSRQSLFMLDGTCIHSTASMNAACSHRQLQLYWWWQHVMTGKRTQCRFISLRVQIEVRSWKCTAHWATGCIYWHWIGHLYPTVTHHIMPLSAHESSPLAYFVPTRACAWTFVIYINWAALPRS